MDEPEEDQEPDLLEEEQEIIEAGFDPLQFWDQYHKSILAAVALIVLGLVGYGIYRYNQARQTAAAGAALAQATTEDELRQVIDNYPGSIAAGDASLLLAGKLRDNDQKYDDALQVLQDFMDKNPTNPLVAGADLSYAETLEAEGKLDDAIARYEEVNAKYSDSYAAPLAVMAEANILKSQGKLDEARRLYDTFITQFPDSLLGPAAQAEKTLLRAPAASAASSAPGENSGGLPNIPNLQNPAVPAVSAASAAPAAPSAPAVPSASAAPVSIPAPSSAPH